MNQSRTWGALTAVRTQRLLTLTVAMQKKLIFHWADLPCKVCKVTFFVAHYARLHESGEEYY
jgi:hypothetical protein